MQNMDKVIEHAVNADKNHASQVGAALREFLRDTRAQAARDDLRAALVAQASGYDGSAHDGATFEARVAAAKAALAAWDGTDCAYRIVIGSSVLGTNDAAILRELGYETPYSNDETRTARPSSGFRNAAVAEICQALSEGLTGEAALLRAIAILRDGRRGPQAAHAEKEAADKRLHAARVERQTAILRARAAGVSKAEIEAIVR